MEKFLSKVKKREEGRVEGTLLSPVTRNAFLKYSGATIVFAGLTIAGCKSKDNPIYRRKGISYHTNNRRDSNKASVVNSNSPFVLACYFNRF